MFEPKPNVGSGADRPPPAGTAVAVGGPGPSPTTSSFLTPGISTVAETATSSPEKKRLPLPSDPEMDQARKAIRDIFKAEFAAAKKPEEKVPLAKKIYDQALADGEPLGRYAMLIEAAALGADGGNAQQVELASRLVASLFEVNEFNWSADIWDAAQKRQPTAIKRELQVGAVHWYKIVQSAVTGIDKAKVDKRIADSAAALVGIKPVRKAKEPAKEMIVPLAPGVDLALNYISRGEFVMGGPSGYESPPHSVRISNGFYFGRFEITQAQWTAVMGTAPWIPAGSYQEGPDYAAGGISQLEASGYCFRLSEIARQQKSIPADARFRLPTEAEWEYACRAGTTSRYSYGDDGNVLGDFAWYESNASKAGESFAHRVGQKKPNAWGLFDMHGNLWELCSDWAGNYPNQAVVDPTGLASGDRVILRGGCWSNNGGNLTCSYRDSGSSSSRVSSSIGFRIVCEISPPAATR